jgi:tetratricopeptide (TPR) repeat protein
MPDRKLANSEPLDLTRHRPDEFIGKSVTINGRDYRIEAPIRQSNQGYMHRLVNQLSGLCLHAIQIRVEYLQSPDAARQASVAKATANMELLVRMRLADPSVAISFLTVKQAHGGSFEVHEYPNGMGWPGQEAMPPGYEGIRDARSMIGRSDYEGALSSLTKVIAAYPNHTEALNLMAICQSSRTDFLKAYAACSRVVEIEPNLPLYRAAQIEAALGMPRRTVASILFNELQTRYPNLSYFDSYGVRANLLIGEPEKARELMERKAIPPREVADLNPIVEAAVSANERYVALEKERYAALAEPSNRLEQNPQADERILRVLEDTHSNYPANPFIQANLAVSLRKSGNYKRAAGLLLSAAGGVPDGLVPYCWSNAAYCLIPLSDWQPAMALLRMTMEVLKKTSNGHVAPADVPGIVNWMSKPNFVSETLDPPAAQLLDRAINDCPDKSLIGPEIREMAALLTKLGAAAKRP